MVIVIFWEQQCSDYGWDLFRQIEKKNKEKLAITYIFTSWQGELNASCSIVSIGLSDSDLECEQQF